MKLQRRAGVALLALLVLAAGGTARAASRPLWEAGLGIGAISFPDYTGSDQQRSYLVPVRKSARQRRSVSA